MAPACINWWQAARGVPTILLPSEKFDINEAFRLIEAHRVTNIFTVPTILKMMVEHPAIDRYDHSSLRYIIYAGAPMYREDQKAALKKLGGVLVQYFGLGEVTGNITVLPPACTIPRMGRMRGSAPAASSARACRSRSRTTMAGS
jgi:fatty-acyl-CoA synthase